MRLFLFTLNLIKTLITMAMQEFEPSPQEMSAVRRYYNDVRNKSTSYIDLQIAAEKLLEQENLGDGGQVYDRLYGVVFPSAEQYRLDSTAALDTFLTFPLEVIAPWIELTRKRDDVVSWYREAVIQIKASTEEGHTDACYQLAKNISVGCERSDICPRRYLSFRLQEAVSNPKFNSPEYVFDPYRCRELALDKLEIAQELEIIGQQDYVAHSSNYTFDFKQQFGDIPGPAL